MLGLIQMTREEPKSHKAGPKSLELIEHLESFCRMHNKGLEKIKREEGRVQ